MTNRISQLYSQKLIIKKDPETIKQMTEIYQSLQDAYEEARLEQERAYYRIQEERRKRILEEISKSN